MRVGSPAGFWSRSPSRVEAGADVSFTLGLSVRWKALEGNERSVPKDRAVAGRYVDAVTRRYARPHASPRDAYPGRNTGLKPGAEQHANAARFSLGPRARFGYGGGMPSP